MKAEDLHDNPLGYEVPAADTLIRVTLSMEKVSTDAPSLAGDNTYMNVQYGSALYDAEVHSDPAGATPCFPASVH